MDAVNRLTEYWCDELLKGAPSLPLAHLQETSMPAELKQELVTLVDAELHDEIERVAANPVFRNSPAGPEALRQQLFNLLTAHIMLTAPLMREVVERVFRNLLEQWRTEPLVFRQAMEDPDVFAAEIFRRASIVTASPSGNGATCPADVLAMVCDAGGIGSLADAIRVEQEMGTAGLTRSDFALLTQRLMLLKERYHIGRRLIAYEGTGRTLVEPSAPITPITAPAPRPAEPPSQPAVQHRAPLLEPSIAEVTLEPAPTPTLAPIAIEPTPTTAKPAARPGLDEAGEHLYNALMAQDNLAFFAEVLFGKDTVAYQRLAYQIARQKKVANAVTLADNELFVREIPSHAIVAVKLLTMIRENFRG
jgi:hypothetical protein